MGKRLYINNTLVDLREDVVIPLNKQIADIRTPENRSSSYTKTITVPGTKANNKLFGFIFDVAQSVINESEAVNFFPDFNPNLKASCRIYDGAALQIEGYAQLLQINIINEHEIEYEIAVFGSLSNIFTSIGSGLLGDLDFSEYDHALTVTNIKNSWDTSIVVNGVSGSPFAYGKGYVYPLIDYGATDEVTRQQIVNMRPSIYAKTIVDKIFEGVGMTYSSDSFFNSDLFKHLIIPFTGTNINQDVDRDLQTLSDLPAYAIAIGDTYKFPLSLGAGAGQYNATTGELTIATGNGGDYYIYGLWTVRINDMTATPGISYRFNLVLKKNGTEIFNTYTRAAGGVGSGVPAVQFDFGTITLADGDVLKWVLKEVFDGTTTTTSGHSIDLFGSVNYQTSSDYLPVNGTVYMNNILPSEILQRDFLISLTRMFNLYWDDGANTLQMLVQDRDTYLSDDINDYTQKIDISNPIKVLPMGDLDANPYVYSYKEDKDFYNDAYKIEFNRVYGDLKFYINNDFLKNENRTEIIFSPTVLVNDPAWLTDMVLSSMRYYDSSGNLVQQGSNIRILYYGGLLPTASAFSLDDGNVLYPQYYYPYAGHLDNPYESTVDLCFYTPQKIYFNNIDNTDLNYTGNNLFEVFHRTMIDEITNKDSKIVRAFFRLRALDILQLDFSYLYYFMGQYFRLNKVIDHYIGTESVTECEFIKSKLRTQELPPPAEGGIGYMIIGSTFKVG